MSYSKHFKHADDVISHLNSFVPKLTDPILQSKYIGFVAVVAVTVFELAIKEIFIDFGQKKHKVLGTFTESHFNRINGRIKLPIIKEEYIRSFGEKYEKRFNTRLKKVIKDYLMLNRRDVLSSYGNLITWRNDFAHEGKLNTTTTFIESIQAYEDGKQIIHCLSDTMKY